MKYRPTPFNIIGIGLGLIAIYYALFPGPAATGFFVTIYFLPSAIGILIADWVLQHRSIPYLRILGAQLLVLGVILFAYTYSQRAKTYLIPDVRSTDYVVTIYEVENAKKLPNKWLNWGYRKQIPQSGIFLTSSKHKADLKYTKMYTLSGISLQNKKDNNPIAFIATASFRIPIKDRSYFVQTWKIADNGSIEYSSIEMEELKQKLKDYLEHLIM